MVQRFAAADPIRLWGLPGWRAGYMECGESSAEGAARETWEEAGARVDVQAPYCHYDIPGIGQACERWPPWSGGCWGAREACTTGANLCCRRPASPACPALAAPGPTHLPTRPPPPTSVLPCRPAVPRAPGRALHLHRAPAREPGGAPLCALGAALGGAGLQLGDHRAAQVGRSGQGAGWCLLAGRTVLAGVGCRSCSRRGRVVATLACPPTLHGPRPSPPPAVLPAAIWRIWSVAPSLCTTVCVCACVCSRCLRHRLHSLCAAAGPRLCRNWSGPGTLPANSPPAPLQALFRSGRAAAPTSPAPSSWWTT